VTAPDPNRQARAKAKPPADSATAVANTDADVAEVYDVFLAMKRRRMHRSFDPEPPTKEQLDQLVYAAGRAPTGRPRMRQIMVIEDPVTLAAFRQCCPGFLNNAPVAFLIFSDLNECYEAAGKRGQYLVARIDAGAAGGYLSLAVTALGLGLVFTTSWNEGVLQELLGLPDHCRPELLIGVGKIAATPSKAIKGKPAIVHRNAYGTYWEALNGKSL
jgi:nitroreductase